MWVYLLSVCVSSVALQLDETTPAELGAAAEVDPGFSRVENPAFPSPELQAPAVERGHKLERADFASYFTESKLADAKQAFDQRRWDKARSLLDGATDTAPVRYLRAMAALRARDNAFASKELEALGETYAPMADRCRVSAGTAYEALKDFASAVRVYLKVPAGSRQFPDARLGLARSYRMLGQWPAAREAVEALAEKPAPPWGRDVGADALWALAELAAGHKEPKVEKELLARLWSGHPLAPGAARAEARLGDLNQLAALRWVERAENLVEAHRNAQGVASVAHVLPSLKLPDPVACRGIFAMGKGYRKQRLHAKAVGTLTPVVAKCTDPDLRARALFTLAISQTFIDPLAAVASYQRLVDDYPGHPYADDSMFSAAEIELKQGQGEAALKRLDELIDRYPTGDFVAEALFRQFWVLRAQSQLEPAVKVLREIERRFLPFEDTHDVERARYWRARTFETQGKTADAVDTYAELAADHPATYHGLLARERLAALDASRAQTISDELTRQAVVRAADPFPLYAGPVGDDPQFFSAVELLRLGQHEQVPMEVLAIDRTRLGPDSLRIMVLLLSMAHEDRAAHGLARIWLRRDLSGRVSAETRQIWEIAYPLAFRELVTKHSEAVKLEPDLLQALMREESALDPKALSWAGALGLTQLMPLTAAEVAGQLKIRRPTTNELLEPDLNLKLGAKYLSNVLAQFKSVKQHAIASYNAGPSAVARWKKERPDDALDEWVENIPLTETRNYVKRVLRSYNTYRLLYAATPSAPAASRATSSHVDTP